MNIYKIACVNNELISCGKVSSQLVLNELDPYQQNKGSYQYIMVMAGDEILARGVAAFLMRKFGNSTIR